MTQQIVTCGNCDRSWDERVFPAPSALCHWCHGDARHIAALDDDETRVIYRQFDEGDSIALFPDQPFTDTTITSYQLIGQHGGADPALVDELHPATEAQALELSLALSRIGYRLKEL